MQAVSRCQPGGFRRRGGTGRGLVAKLPEFLFQALAQPFGASEKALTGAGLEEQAIPVAGNTYLAAVLVTPGSQSLQRLPLRQPLMLNGLWRDGWASAVLSPKPEVQGQLWKADSQPARRGCCFLLMGHGVQFGGVVSQKPRKAVESGPVRAAGFRGT